MDGVGIGLLVVLVFGAFIAWRVKKTGDKPESTSTGGNRKAGPKKNKS